MSSQDHEQSGRLHPLTCTKSTNTQASSLPAKKDPKITVPAQTFSRFPELAFELREMIWKEALPEWRFVHVQHTSKIRNGRDPVTKPDDYLFSATCIPGMLHACSESRCITKSAGWALEFGKDGKEGRVWFNFEKDVLYFPRLSSHLSDQRGVYALMTATQKNTIRRLARRPYQAPWAGTNIFPNLQEVFVVMDHGGLGLLSRPRAAFKFPLHPGSKTWYQKTFTRIRKELTWPQSYALRKYRERKAEILCCEELWKFLDADASEARCYAGCGRIFGNQHFSATGGRRGGEVMERHWFKEVQEAFEGDVRHMMENGHTVPWKWIPKIRIGILVPESRAQVVLKLREEYWGNEDI